MSENVQPLTCDLAVLGAGAAGLAAAAAAAQTAGLQILILDREELAGGILRQCIHNGFGLEYFKRELTGPEYAELALRQAREAGERVAFLTGATITDACRDADGSFSLTGYSKTHGALRIRARALFLGMGCRERNRGNLAVPGTRPAGVYTAGAAQRLINIEGMLPGRSAVIVGSGDIGLIMARRLKWSGVEVKAVVEILPTPSGLPRNVAQCIEDFGIPLYLEHAVTRIDGDRRVEGVDVAPLHDGIPDPARQFRIACDTVLFSVGLIPENELSRQLGVELNPATGGPLVDDRLMTSVPGVFAGGNVLHVHDLADSVSKESAQAGRSAATWLTGDAPPPGETCTVVAGANLRYVVPNTCRPGGDAVHFRFRPLIACEKSVLEACREGAVFWRKPYRYVKPAEMITAEIPGLLLNESGGRAITFELREEADDVR